MVSNDSDFFIHGGSYAPLYTLRLDGNVAWARVHPPGALARHLGLAPALLPALATLCGSVCSVAKHNLHCLEQCQ
jgi:hypothetical protein